jgi:hypothetical protein
VALAAAIEWDVASTGNDNNGGGYKAGATGVDYSQQDAPQKSGTDLEIDGTDAAKVKPVGAGVAANDVGNVIQIPSGVPSFTAGFYEILSQDGTWWTLDRAAGTLAASGGTYAMGGRLATLGKCGGAHAASNTIWWKGAQVATSTTSNVSNGRVTLTAGASVTAPTTLRSYQTTHGDETGTRGSFEWGVNAANNYLVSVPGNCVVANCVLDGKRAGFTQVRGLNATAAPATLYNIKFTGYNAGAVVVASNVIGIAIGIEATDCVTSAVFTLSTNIWTFAGCYIHDNTVAAIAASTGALYVDKCLFDTNTAAITGSPARVHISDTITYVSGEIQLPTGCYGALINVHCEGSSGRGINLAGACPGLFLLHCSGYNNTSGHYQTANIPARNVVSFLSPSASVFADGANGDFQLNNTASAGADLRATAWPNPYTGLSGVANYRDRGGYQHQDAPAVTHWILKRKKYMRPAPVALRRRKRVLVQQVVNNIQTVVIRKRRRVM